MVLLLTAKMPSPKPQSCTLKPQNPKTLKPKTLKTSTLEPLTSTYYLPVAHLKLHRKRRKPPGLGPDLSGLRHFRTYTLNLKP